MDILSSGSFVPLDSREKIEQLKFTAKELASEAAKTEGFQNNGPTNQQLALEMWKGAEYMCRAHEEATVRNIFLSSFLEKLRDLARTTRAQPASQVVQRPQLPPIQTAPVGIADPPPVVVDQAVAAVVTHKYLGVAQAIEEPAQESQSSYADEGVQEYDAAIEAIVDRLEDEHSASNACGSSETIGTGSQEPEITPVANVSSEEPEPDIPPSDFVAGDGVVKEKLEAEVTESSESSELTAIGSIVIAEKEPYNFDSCTVTAVVQLLPESAGFRKCVVSVRSHDFIPHIAISDLANGNVAEDIKRGLETAFEQYRAKLPIMAAKKIKNEKPAAKKRSSKPAEKATAANASADMKSTVVAQTSEAAQGQNSLFIS